MVSLIARGGTMALIGQSVYQYKGIFRLPNRRAIVSNKGLIMIFSPMNQLFLLKKLVCRNDGDQKRGGSIVYPENIK